MPLFRNPKKKSKYSFTLLEVMVAILLLTLAAGAVGIRMHHAVQKKRFHADLDRLRARLLVAHKLSIATQADWMGTLAKRGKEWCLELSCEESQIQKLPPLQLQSSSFFFNGKPMDALTLYFFSTGKVLPEGTFLFLRDSEKVVWKSSELFHSDFNNNKPLNSK